VLIGDQGLPRTSATSGDRIPAAGQGATATGFAHIGGDLLADFLPSPRPGGPHQPPTLVASGPDGVPVRILSSHTPPARCAAPRGDGPSSTFSSRPYSLQLFRMRSVRPAEQADAVTHGQEPSAGEATHPLGGLSHAPARCLAPQSPHAPRYSRRKTASFKFREHRARKYAMGARMQPSRCSFLRPSGGMDRASVVADVGRSSLSRCQPSDSLPPARPFSTFTKVIPGGALLGLPTQLGP